MNVVAYILGLLFGALFVLQFTCIPNPSNILILVLVISVGFLIGTQT